MRKKAMIPVLRAIVASGYLCSDCARATLANRAPSGDGAQGADAAQKPAASDPAARPTSPGSAGTPTR